MTEKDLEIQRLRRENERLKAFVKVNIENCGLCKHKYNETCYEVDYHCDLCVAECKCRNCDLGSNWELADE